MGVEFPFWVLTSGTATPGDCDVGRTRYLRRTHAHAHSHTQQVSGNSLGVNVTVDIVVSMAFTVTTGRTGHCDNTAVI